MTPHFIRSAFPVHWLPPPQLAYTYLYNPRGTRTANRLATYPTGCLCQFHLGSGSSGVAWIMVGCRIRYPPPQDRMCCRTRKELTGGKGCAILRAGGAGGGVVSVRSGGIADELELVARKVTEPCVSRWYT